MDAELWDSIYASREADTSREPNPQLVAEAAGLAPGAALDVGCAEGCDSEWLAARGWHVTGVDLSEVALERARQATTRFAGRVTWVQGDLREWTPSAASYDLVTSHFVHFVPDERAIVTARLAAAVRPGGTLLIVAHHPTDLQTTVKRWPVPEAYAPAEQLAALLPAGEWEILVAEARPREVADPDGNRVTVHDAILRARRR